MQRRFMVLTEKWMFNVEAEFEKKTKGVTFKKMKWRHPIEAIVNVEIGKKDDKIELKITWDQD